MIQTVKRGTLALVDGTGFRPIQPALPPIAAKGVVAAYLQNWRVMPAAKPRGRPTASPRYRHLRGTGRTARPSRTPPAGWAHSALLPGRYDVPVREAASGMSATTTDDLGADPEPRAA